MTNSCSFCKTYTPEQKLRKYLATLLSSISTLQPMKVDFKFSCATCQVQCPCETALNAHLAGKQHKKKLESAKLTIFCCGVCKIETSNQGGLDMHMAGKSHLKKLAKLGNTG